MKKFVIGCRYLLAVVFIFSGFVKGIDPLGSAYKFHDYFMAFHLGFLEPLSLTFAFVLCAAEILIGLTLLFGVKLKLSAWSAFLFMLLFTPLTLILAIFNPVSDCGCFGDAIHLSNWQTFYKNILFFAASVVLFVYRKTLVEGFSPKKEGVLLALLTILAFVPSFHGYRHLPVFDFMPYHVGANIPDGMTTPDDAPSDEYKTLLYYSKNGEVKEFDEANYPWDDSTWTFVDSKSILIKKGYTPSISNFSLNTADGEDITDRFINAPGYSFLAVSSRLDRFNASSYKQLAELYYKATEKGYGFICATGTSHDLVPDFVAKYAIPFPIVTADEVTLKSVVRANPGLLLLYNGTVVGKWHWRDFPDAELLDKNMFAVQLSEARLHSNLRLTVALGLLLILGLIVVNFRE